VFRSVKELEVAIREYIAVHNENPKPFVLDENGGSNPGQYRPLRAAHGCRPVFLTYVKNHWDRRLGWTSCVKQSAEVLMSNVFLGVSIRHTRLHSLILTRLMDGHTLVTPRLHFASIYELTAELQSAVWNLVAEVRERLLTGLKLDGFNIGVNDCLASGDEGGFR
jgi:hypothetical protein